METYDLEVAIRDSLNTWQKHHEHLSEYRQRLDRRLNDLQLCLRADVASDGNCLFACISDQLLRCGMGRKTATELRAMGVEYLSKLVSDVPACVCDCPGLI